MSFAKPLRNPGTMLVVAVMLVAAQASAAGAQGCLAAAEVSRLVGLEVRAFPQGTRSYGPNVVCAYQATNQDLGAFVTTVVGPAAGRDEVLTEMKESAKTFAGESAELETVRVGDGGFAYGSSSKSEAAAVTGGRLYHAEISSTASANIGDKKAALIEVLKKMMGR
ncbi:MAG TPA: hypothetical protein VJ596_01515 [Gemmatimonadaceae bacterium]|nr:hypothetical protein [Gemmatimonadaceae bacterium]